MSCSQILITDKHLNAADVRLTLNLKETYYITYFQMHKCYRRTSDVAAFDICVQLDLI